MSAGRRHTRANLRHPAELKKLLSEGDAPQLMRRWQRLDVDHDVADLAGYNVAGTVRFLDRDFFRALLDPEYATKVFGEPVDTGLSPDDTVECLLEHEGDEKVILDADNDVDSYDAAHEFSTLGEHEKVRTKGGSPIKYERGLKKAIAWCALKPLKVVPKDLACAPVLDDPDRNDKRIIKELRALGVTDAFKAAKNTVQYGRSTGADQCRRCEHWQGDRGQALSPCDRVEGLVRQDRWCKLFSEEGKDEQGLDQGRGQEQGRAAPQPRRA